MKIKFDYQIFGTQTYGGISKYFYYLAKELNNQGEEAHIVAPFHINKNLKRNKDNFIKGVYLNFRSRLLIRILRYINMLIDYFIKVDSYDIVHKTYYSFISESKTLKSNKLITTAHDMIYEIYPEYFKFAEKNSFARKQAFESSNHIIAVSNNTKKDLINIFNINEDKISVVYHGVDKSIFFENRNNKFSNSYGEYILYVGKRFGYKNFSTLLKSYIEYEEINSKLSLIVFGGELISSNEKKMIISNQLEEKIIFIDGDDVSLAKIYNGAKVFVYTSIYEGFGMPILEAMACGCPVIASNTGSIPEIAGKSALLVNDIKNVSELAKAIKLIISDTRICGNLISKGHLNIQRFSWNKCAKETLRIYNKVI